ncbi:primosomal protein N' [Carboxydocella sp. ULO1]|uniref:primosomal protein N' n=1 Tax=Carboxydocella sp. ULO1 TaxID=1926599 RepID=UPI0009ABD63D|nr:primosomal protein N' [Carboxydocella sp. ULO1]GAW30112.1 primosomal protein N' [Carboxydocella sp. ULO1]
MGKNPVYAEVYIDRPVKELDRPLTYRIPDQLQGQVRPGMRVQVPLGRQGRVQAFVTAITDQRPPVQVRDIIGLIDREPIIDEELLGLARWLADYYVCPLVTAIHTLVPPGKKNSGGTLVALTPRGWAYLNQQDDEEEEAGLEMLEWLAARGGEADAPSLRAMFRSQGQQVLKKLQAAGLVQVEQFKMVGEKGTGKLGIYPAFPPEELAVHLLSLSPRASKSRQALTVACAVPGLTVKELAARAEVTESVIRGLLDKGLLCQKAISLQAEQPERKVVWPRLTPAQQAAFQAIEESIVKGRRKKFLLFGVTGSGKTEIYLRAIASCLERGQTAICLVPEISLTPQIAARFKERFGADVAVFHSRLSLRERHLEWQRIKEGKIKVVVGARSAIFAPLQKLGLIIIDEEHETSYKQDVTPRYHAREVAQERARRTGATLVLGSATPAVETFYRAQQGEFTLLTLAERIDDRPLPPVTVVDMRQELAEGNRSIFSRELQEALRHTLQRGEQAILFLNRRGYSTFVSCRSCGYVLRCPACDVTLTYHSSDQTVRCHYCEHREPSPALCPRCNSRYIRYFGAGTQRVAEEFAREFPGVSWQRMDVDTTSRRGAHETIIQNMLEEKIQVLIGTQMIAKGLDFPKVTLVGVISADTSLNVPDFRSGERTFQLLTQVGGRAGRDVLPGRVIIQTYSPEHYSILRAVEHDYPGFYREELELREMLGNPPFSYLVRLLLSGPREEEVIRGSQLICDWLQPGLQADQSLLGPAPAPLSRLRGQYRWHLAIKGPELEGLRSLGREVLQKWSKQRSGEVRLVLDIEPVSLL